MKEELVYIGKKILEHKYSLSEKLAERLDATHTLSLEELKEKKNDVKIIVYSGIRDEKLIESIKRLGVESYIAKPARIDQIEQSIKQAMNDPI